MVVASRKEKKGGEEKRIKENVSISCSFLCFLSFSLPFISKVVKGRKRRNEKRNEKKGKKRKRLKKK